MNTHPVNAIAIVSMAGVYLLGVTSVAPLDTDAQTAISTDGVVESKSGGFKFPDGTIQTTAAAPPSTITEYRIVGFTTATTDGSVTTTDRLGASVFGIVALNRLCAVEFGTAARAAFTAEQLAPSIAPSTAPFSAWIRPTSMHLVYVPDANNLDWLAFDAEGIMTGVDSSSFSYASSYNFDCKGFTSDLATAVGFARQKSGGFLNWQCSSTHFVACSAPVQITNTNQ